MKSIIDPNWNFKQIVYNLETIRTHYEDILSSFSYFELHKVVEFKTEIRNSIYSLNIEEYQKDKIWDYMNHFEFLYVLKGIAERRKQ